MLVMQSSWVRGKCIGQGAFGTAYLAVSNRDERVFAVKSVDRTTGQPGQVEALENEIRILRDMSSSPHVVAFLGEDHTCERGKTASFRNLHMEYLPGGTVADVAGNGDVDERLVRRYAWCLTSALRDVHARGVVHCDVKGRNVLVAGDGAAKLADFGAAVEFTGGECCSRGSPLWMAPEVVRREYQGPESDVWSLGCTVIEMVTGKPAWEDRGVDTLSRIGFSDELPEFPGGLSELGRDFVEKCLRRDRSRRWSCDQLLQHPFLLPVESSPRCVMDWVDSRFSESETEFEDEEEVELSKEEENSVRERIGKLANVSRVNWESEGWVVVREVASDAEATMEKVTAACDEGECVGARWELGNVTRVEEEIEVGTSLEYSDSGGFGGERVNREMWEFGGGWKRWLLWRRECDQCNRNHRKDNITGGSCWRCRYEEKFNRIIILFTIYRLYCKIFNSCYLFSIYNYPFRLKKKKKKKRAHSLPSCSPSIIHRRTAACTLKHHFRGHRQTPHRCVIAEKHHKAPDFEHSSIGLIVRAKMDLQKSIRCQTEVALSITKHLFSKEEYQEKNLVFSPFSLHAILSVMAVGSAGSTLDELFSFLRFDSVDHLNTFFSQVLSTVLSDTTPSFLLSFVNEMWADKSLALSHSFKQLMTTHYKATLALVDFRTKGDQVCREVNSWVEKETNGLITELLPTNAVHKLTKLIFANALYFKGVWKHTFDPSMTFVDDFHLLNGTSIEVPFMSSEKKTQFIRTFDGFNVLRLSYKQGRDKKLRFSMCIFLPNAKDGLPSLIEKLASESCFLKGKLPRQKVRVRKFRIPKFKICFELEASNVLKELGVVSPFSKSNANFTKMVVSPLDELCVESIHHKASIEVNEEGTEAGVACSMCDVKLCVSARTGIDFVADHPFLFLIREDLTGTILFIGQVLHPEGAAMSLKEEDSETEYLNMLRDRTRMGRKEEAKAMRTAMLSLRFPPKRKRRQNLVNLILNRRRIKKFA